MTSGAEWPVAQVTLADPKTRAGLTEPNLARMCPA